LPPKNENSFDFSNREDTVRLGMRRVMQPSIMRPYIPLLLVLVFVEGGGAGAGGLGAGGGVGAGGERARGSQGCLELPWILSRSSPLAFSPLWLAAPPNFPRRRTAAQQQQQQQQKQQQQERLIMQRRISMIPRTSPPCGTTRTRTIMKSGGGNMKGDGAPEGGGGSGGGGGGGGGGKVGGRSAKAPLSSSSSSSSPTSPSMSKQQMDDRGGTGNAGGDVSKVKSPVTGRLINVGGPSYVKLMELGYIRSGDEIVHRNVVSGDGVTPPPKYMERIDEPEELDALRGDIRQLWPGVGEVLERLGGEDVVYDKLRPIFDKLKEGDYVDVYTLRTVLITVNVSISAAKMLDLMDVATDAEGRVLLDYDAFEDLMLDILPSIDDGAPGEAHAQTLYGAGIVCRGSRFEGTLASIDDGAPFGVADLTFSMVSGVEGLGHACLDRWPRSRWRRRPELGHDLGSRISGLGCACLF
jgi:hypothetical protein